MTHMDSVTWTEARLLQCLREELGFTTAVFAQKNTPGTKNPESYLAGMQGTVGRDNQFCKLLEVFQDQ